METANVRTLTQTTDSLEKRLLSMTLPTTIPRLNVSEKSFRVGSAGTRYNSQTSPRQSWEETYMEISRGLQQICGSPVNTPMSPRLVETAEKSSPRSSVAKQLFSRHEFRRTESLYGSVSRSQQRQLVVRHIETQAELRNKLSAICRSNPRRDSDEVMDQNLDDSPDAVPQSSTVRACAQLIATGFRLKLDLNKISLEDIVVAVTNGKHLVVKSLRGPRRNIIESTLPEDVCVNRLSCVLTAENSLIIRSRINDTIQMECVNTDTVFLPVISANEAKRELTIVLHVPEVFSFEDVIVRTVDNKVVITENKKNVSPQVLFLSKNFTFPVLEMGSVDNSVQPSFQISFKLPEGTDSRSVSATLTKRNQLVIMGRLGPSSRRYSI